LDTVFNQFSKRVNRKTSDVSLFNRREISSLSKLIYPIGIVALFLSTIEAGIKEDVETLLKNQFGEAAHLSMKKLILDRKTKSMVERKVHQHFFKDFIYAWTITEGESIKAYCLLDNVKGLSMPITFLVIYNPLGKILTTRVIKYREPYGGEIASQNWTAQFNGRNAESNYVVGDEIDGISGATISVYSMANGVRKLSVLFPLIKSQL